MKQVSICKGLMGVVSARHNRAGPSPKRGVGGSSPLWDAKNTAASRFSPVCSVYFFFSRIFRSSKAGRILCAANVYPAKKKRTISTFLLRKILSLLIGIFGPTCRPVPPRAAQPGCLPVPVTAGAVPPGPPDRASPVPVPSAPPGDELRAGWDLRRRRSRTSGR